MTSQTKVHHIEITLCQRYALTMSITIMLYSFLKLMFKSPIKHNILNANIYLQIMNTFEVTGGGGPLMLLVASAGRFSC